MNGFTVEVLGLTKVFGDEGRGRVVAVDGVSFRCAPGEIFGLLGANGAGKTTTLRMLATVLRPTAGTATVAGFDLVREPEMVRRSLGFHSSTTALYPRLTARETIEFFARVNGLSPQDARARVRNLIAQFGIGEYADVRVERLSQGMRQKVSLARTVAHDPPVLIFDEPTVGLDVFNALQMQEMILQLKGQGKTILFSTHLMSEAERLCDRIAIIHRGRILACDTLQGLRETTGHRYLEDIFVSLVRGSGGADLG